MKNFSPVFWQCCTIATGRCATTQHLVDGLSLSHKRPAFTTAGGSHNSLCNAVCRHFSPASFLGQGLKTRGFPHYPQGFPQGSPPQIMSTVATFGFKRRLIAHMQPKNPADTRPAHRIVLHIRHCVHAPCAWLQRTTNGTPVALCGQVLSRLSQKAGWPGIRRARGFEKTGGACAGDQGSPAYNMSRALRGRPSHPPRRQACAVNTGCAHRSTPQPFFV